MQINPRPYAIERIEPKTISRDAFVAWGTNCYSVPWKHDGKNALVRESESGTIAVEVGGEVVASFPLRFWKDSPTVCRNSSLILQGSERGDLWGKQGRFSI